MTGNKRLTRAVLCIVASALFFAMMNMFVSLSGDVPVIQKTFFRNLFALMIASVAMIKNKHKILPEKKYAPGLIMRSAFGYFGVCCNFFALSSLPVADASLLNKMSPFFAVIFSIFILKEKADKIQWLIILTAFAGAMFVLKPGFANAQLLPSVAGFVGGACAGLAYTFVRKLTKEGEKGYYIVFFFSAFSTLCALPFTIIGYSPMTVVQLLCLMGAGVSAAIAQFCITTAYSYAPAKEVSIYDYSQIVFAGLLGYFVMGQTPDLLSFIGYIIIIGAAFGMFRYNNRKTENARQK